MAVPTALVTAVSIAGFAGGSGAAGESAASVADAEAAQALQRLADSGVVREDAVEASASVSEPGKVLAATDAGFRAVVARPSAGDVPVAALTAYQRAETVINAADPGCHLTWQLLAALGRVESDHGRFGGSRLDAAGVARPAIVGVRLNGRGGTARVVDTDAGQLDDDSRFDRAVGPMQFIPSTWSTVAVDADDDGKRNPQDVDDAALAAAVYLCSGGQDLATQSGLRSSIHRYNHSQAYVELVLGVMRDYLEGDYDTAPSAVVNAGSLSSGSVVPLAPLPKVSRDSDKGGAANDRAAKSRAGKSRAAKDRADKDRAAKDKDRAGMDKGRAGKDRAGKDKDRAAKDKDRAAKDKGRAGKDRAGKDNDNGRDKGRDGKDGRVRETDTSSTLDQARGGGDDKRDSGGKGKDDESGTGETGGPETKPGKNPEPEEEQPTTEEEQHEPGTLTPDEAALHCVGLGYVDDRDKTEDDYDVCFAEYVDPAEVDPGDPDGGAAYLRAQSARSTAGRRAAAG